MSRVLLAFVPAVLFATTLAAAPPGPDETWPGFRGHELSGIAPGGSVPERWSVTDHVRWKLDVPGRGWSSPIVWGNTVFLTSAHQRQAVQAADPWSLRQRLHRRDAGPGAAGRGDQAPRPRSRQRNQRRSGRDPLHGLRRRRRHRQDQVGARSPPPGAARRPPSQEHLRLRDAVHRRRAALCLVRPERRVVLLFDDRRSAVEEGMAAAADLSRLRHGVVAGRARWPGLSAARQRGRVLHHRARRQNRPGAVADQPPEHRPAAVVLDHAVHLAARPPHRDRDDRTRRS